MTKRVLFVCTGNTCRSPMAMALFNKYAEDNNIDAIADSAGVAAQEDMPPSDNTVAVLKEMGVDISDYLSKPTYDYLLGISDLIVCMSDSHCKVLESFGYDSILFDNGIADPYGCSIDVYRECRDKMLDVIPRLAELL